MTNRKILSINVDMHMNTILRYNKFLPKDKQICWDKRLSFRFKLRLHSNNKNMTPFIMNTYFKGLLFI